jgi:hypothetical protein
MQLNRIEKNYDKIVRYLSMATTMPFIKREGLADMTIEEALEFTEEMKEYLIRYKDNFRLQQIKISEMVEIMKTEKEWVLSNIVRENEAKKEI